MRICYLVPGSLSGHAPGEAGRRDAYLGAHAAEDVEVAVRDNPDGPASVESEADEEEAGARLQPLLAPLQSQGFDALIIGCFGDPGLAAARRRVKIPVVGPAQAALHLSAQLGDGFAVITVVEAVVPMLHELAERYGVARALREVTAVEVPVLELRARRDEVLERLEQAGRSAIGNGAEVVVLGCMTLGFVDVAIELQAALGVPVVNPVLASLHTATTLARVSAIRPAPSAPRVPTV